MKYVSTCTLPWYYWYRMLERSRSERTVSSLPTIKLAWTYACLLFVWNHHLEHRERTLHSTYRFQEQGCLNGSPTVFHDKDSKTMNLKCCQQTHERNYIEHQTVWLRQICMNGIFEICVYIGNPNQTRHLGDHHRKIKVLEQGRHTMLISSWTRVLLPSRPPLRRVKMYVAISERTHRRTLEADRILKCNDSGFKGS